jgi:PKHD-type hydroxylase
MIAHSTLSLLLLSTTALAVQSSHLTAVALEFPRLFSPAECSAIVRDALSRGQIAKPTLRAPNGTDAYSPRDRDGQLSWLPIGPSTDFSWVRTRMEQAITVGERAWQLSVAGLASNSHVQVSHYGPGGHYTWHTDAASPTDHADSDTEETVQWSDNDRRVLSVTVQLSPEDKYTGGVFELAGHGNASRGQGTAIIFPSMLPHVVHPVSSGMRHSIVAWFRGDWISGADATTPH